MGLSNKTAPTKWGLVSLLVMVSTAAIAEANRIARDPTVGPAAHTASLLTVIALWSNWVTAVLAAPLAIGCLLYYMAVLYESKLFIRLCEVWRARHSSPEVNRVATAAKVDAAAVAQAAKADAAGVAATVEASRVEVAANVEAARVSQESK